MITLRGVAKRYGPLAVLRGVDAHISKGECIAIIGPSGTGKSVLFRTLAMLERPDAGSICLQGTDITAPGTDLNQVRRNMGMVYQDFRLFSHLNVLDNIILAPRRVNGQPRRAAEQKARELLALVGLLDKAASWPHELSGGQQQRIAIARCLAMEPEIMLFDEPTSALDPTMTREVLAIIRKLATRGLTLLIITHEMAFARDIADRIFYLDDGTIYEAGTPSEIFDHPQREKTRSFISRLNRFTHTVRSKSFDMVAMNARLEDYCQQRQVSVKSVYHLQLVLEELLMELFRRCYENAPPDIELTVACAAADHTLTISCRYRAAAYDPFAAAGDGIDDLGMLLIRKLTDTAAHTYADGCNTLQFKLKEEVPCNAF